jgi:Bacterial Ig-like domain
VRYLDIVKTRRTLRAPILACSVVAGLSAQPSSTRIATTAEALSAAPVFFHGKQVIVHRDVEPVGPLLRLTGTAKPIFVFWRASPSVPRDAEVRGEFWDLGRLERNDSRVSNVNFDAILEALPNRGWPARDQVFLITNASAVESPLPPEPTLRALALAPEKYLGKGVTVTGRFRGANLFADLPSGAGTKGRWDFVVQSADAAIWVTGVRPRGRGFDLDVNARMDAGRWLQIAGTLRREGPLPYIEATSVAEGRAPNETTVEIALPPPPPELPPAVVFSAPTAGETDAERALPIRIQFSRDMDPKSFVNHVRIAYVGPAPSGAPAIPSFTIRYVEGNRALELKPSAPLDRFRNVKVDLLEGIVSAIDNLPLAPWSLTFTTGG